MENKKQKTLANGRFVDPAEILKQLDFKEGQVVADFGCGAGFFSIPMAQRVGDEGKVYALDILQAQLDAVEGRAKMFDLDNVITKRVNLESAGGSSLEDKSVNWIVIKDILSQNQNKKVIIQEARRVLKDDGQMIFIEWNDNQSVGPEDKFRVSKDELMKIVEENQFAIKQSLEAGDFHYAFIVEKV